jgi:enoyl-CoA hydratase/carnithine racemase
MAGYANIKLERDGAVARLMLNRPERRNALTHAMMLELEDALAGLRQDNRCRAVVIRGAGGHFCAGGDLDAMADMPPEPANGAVDPLIAAYRQFGDALLALNGLPQVTISIVEGSAVGGGFGMACCSDVVILHETAGFGMPEPKVGFIPSQIIPLRGAPHRRGAGARPRRHRPGDRRQGSISAGHRPSHLRQHCRDQPHSEGRARRRAAAGARGRRRRQASGAELRHER